MVSQEEVLRWLTAEGFSVRVESVPPFAPLDWLLLVEVPSIPRIHVAIQKPKARDDIVALGIGVALGPDHRDAFASLPRNERIAIASQILHDLVMFCRDCSVGLQPSLEELQFINVTKVLYASDLSREKLSTAVREMSNAFALIVSILNRELSIRGVELGARRREDMTVM
ncbi:MAG: DUF2299 family protein [Acidilobaceae archaeon]